VSLTSRAPVGPELALLEGSKGTVFMAGSAWIVVSAGSEGFLPQGSHVTPQFPSPLLTPSPPPHSHPPLPIPTPQVLDTALVVNRPKTATQLSLRISESTVGDASGVITLVARNQMVDHVEAGKTITVEGARVEMFKGSMRVVVDGRGGSVREAEGARVEANKDVNMSLLEFDIIPLGPAEVRRGGVVGVLYCTGIGIFLTP
jgi:replication factor A1